MRHCAARLASGVVLWQWPPHFAGRGFLIPLIQRIRKARHGMIKPEWGTKRTCPKCATRFYDLQKNEPVVCIECSYSWVPEAILKSKQPMPFEAAKAEKSAPDSDLAGDDENDLVADEDEEPSADDEVDLGGDDDLGVEAPSSDDENN